MARLFQLPRQVPIVSGAVSAGCKAHFYLTGTTTNADTYTDAALTTTSANPVIADSSGVFAAIYLDPDVDYKLTLKDTNDALIYSVDPVIDTLSQENVGKIFYPQTSVESSASVTPTNYQYEPGDVRRYGVVGNGSTDDATALNDAILASEGAPYPLVFSANTTYAIASQLSSVGDIVIEGNGATIKPSATTNGLIVNPGSNIGTTTLSADAQVNTNSITVTSATNISAGVLIKLTSSAAWHYDPGASQVKGELHVVKSVSGATVELEDTLFDNYDVSGETVTVTILRKASFICRDLNIEYASPTAAVGFEIRNIVRGHIQNIIVDGSQTQGLNLDQCYSVSVSNGHFYRCNNSGLGYGVQLNGCMKCSVKDSHFLQCKRGVDLSGTYPTRKTIVSGNSVDGSGDDHTGSALPSNSASSGLGSHETAEHNIYSNNFIANVKHGILLRGADAVVKDNHFVGDINNECVLINKAVNITITNNTYAANLRPSKTLDVVASDDDQQKAPWFVKVVDPDVNAYYYIQNNTADDLKNALIIFVITAADQTINNFYITGNVVTMLGSTSDTTVYILESSDENFVLEDSIILDNLIVEDTASLVEYDTAITIDYAGTVEIDNFPLPISVLTETTGASEANINKNKVQLQLTVRDGVVSVVGYVDFDISNATSVVKLQNLPVKTTVAGSYGPAYGWPFIEGVATGSIGALGMVCSPAGTTGSIPHSWWLSFDQTAYNTGWPVGTAYRVPIDIRYYTERRRV